MMQTDVKQAHLNQSGFFVLGRNRIKGITFTGTSGAAGQIAFFDTTTAPVSASVTYGRSGATVTIAKTAHGLTTGTIVGIHFATGTGGSATEGNYPITVTTADAFTITDINSGTITGTPAAVYCATGNWLLTQEPASNDVFNNFQLLPGEGILAKNGIYGFMLNVQAASVYYG
jgi:hypothetical protein